MQCYWDLTIGMIDLHFGLSYLTVLHSSHEGEELKIEETYVIYDCKHIISSNMPNLKVWIDSL